MFIKTEAKETMADPTEISKVIGTFIDANLFGQVVTYIGYALLAVLVVGVFYVLYLMIQYKYKVSYPVLHYGEDKKSARVIAWKKDYACNTKVGGVRKQKLLFKRLVIEPFKESEVHPGNKINVLRFNQDGTYQYMPSIKFTEEISKFELIAPEESYWGIMQLKDNAQSYTSEDAQRRMLTMTVATIVLCLILCGLTVWLSLKSPGKLVASFDSWGQSFQQFAQNVGGAPPG